MVAPFDIHPVIGHQIVQNLICPGAPVKNIPHQMQLVHHPLDQGGEGLNQAVRLVDFNHRGDDIFEIIVLIHLLGMGVEQFFDNVGIVRV